MSIESVEELNRIDKDHKRRFQALFDADPGLLARRVQSYDRRWKEALAHTELGSRLLDIGCGQLPNDILHKIVIDHRIDYHCMDIDRSTVAEMREKLRAVNRCPENAQQSDNTVIPFPNEKFDFIFASHCLEHSIDIVRTLFECCRVLRPGGKLFMGVPLGFDDSAEHTMFLGPEEWLRLLSLCGFTVVSHAVGTTYVETGDLAVVAIRDVSTVDEIGAQRLVARFRKAGATFVRATDKAFAFPPEAITNPDATIMRGIGSVCQISVETPPKALVIVRHAWSGMVLIEDGASRLAVDAYSSVPYLYAVTLEGFAPMLQVAIVGANLLAYDQQIAVAGILL